MNRKHLKRLSWPALIGGFFILSTLEMLETNVFAQSEFQASVVPQMTLIDEGNSLTTRNKLNFVGEGVSCVDNATDGRTDCTVAPGGYTTSAGGVTRPNNSSDHFAIGSGGSGTAPLFFNQTTGQLEINVAGGGLVTDADATLGGKLVLQESSAQGSETFTLGVADAGLAANASCTLQSDGTWLPAACPFNLSVGELSNVTETSISTNDVLTWNGSAWVNQAAQGGSTPSLGELSNVTETSVTTNDVLTWNGSAWVNQAAQGGGTRVGTKAFIISGSTDGSCNGMPATYDTIQCLAKGNSNNNSLTALGMTATTNDSVSYTDLIFGNAGSYVIQVEVEGRESASTTAPHAWCVTAWQKRSSSYLEGTPPAGYANALAEIVDSGPPGFGGSNFQYFGFSSATRIWDVQANDVLELYASSCNNTNSTAGQATSPDTVIGTTSIYSVKLYITRLH